eukprot:916128-Prymnesium_polylepis.1
MAEASAPADELLPTILNDLVPFFITCTAAPAPRHTTHPRAHSSPPRRKAHSRVFRPRAQSQFGGGGDRPPDGDREDRRAGAVRRRDQRRPRHHLPRPGRLVRARARGRPGALRL